MEDEPDINNLLARILREEDYKVSQAFSEQRPNGDGKGNAGPYPAGSYAAGNVRRRIAPRPEREPEISYPVIVISAKGLLEDKVSLLKMGGG